MVFAAHQNANRFVEEICGVNIDLVDHGLRIVHQYHLLLSDINCPPRTQYNILHSRITQLIESRDDPLPSLEPPTSSPLPMKLRAANMVNCLMEMVAIIGSDIDDLCKETTALFEVLFPVSIGSLCWSIVTGRCNINNRATSNIVDKWETDYVGSEREIRWNDMISRAKNLLVDATNVLSSGLHVPEMGTNDTGPMTIPGSSTSHLTKADGTDQAFPALITEERDGSDGDPAKNATASGSGTKVSGKSTRRRNKKERGYLVGSEGQW